MSQDVTIAFTLKELIQQVNERLGALDQKLDLRLAVIDERIMQLERTQSERQHLVAEFVDFKARVEVLEQEHNRRLAVTSWSRYLVSLLPIGVVLGWFLQERF